MQLIVLYSVALFCLIMCQITSYIVAVFIVFLFFFCLLKWEVCVICAQRCQARALHQSPIVSSDALYVVSRCLFLFLLVLLHLCLIRTDNGDDIGVSIHTCIQ